MAQITIDIPNAVALRVQGAICERFGYQATTTNPDGTTSPNPETKTQFSKRMLAREVKAWVLEQELNTTVNNLRNTEYTKLDGELNIT